MPSRLFKQTGMSGRDLIISFTTNCVILSHHGKRTRVVWTLSCSLWALCPYYCHSHRPGCLHSSLGQQVTCNWHTLIVIVRLQMQHPNAFIFTSADSNPFHWKQDVLCNSHGEYWWSPRFFNSVRQHPCGKLCSKRDGRHFSDHKPWVTWAVEVLTWEQ